VTRLRIGINALYLIPGCVGGTEIYLRSLLDALGRIDESNEYFVFVNRESTSARLVALPPFHLIPCAVSARRRPHRILWEQIMFPLLLKRHGIDVLLNPGFTMPLLFGGPSVTVFHDLQHKRHPEFFRWFDLPFWKLLLWAAARRSRRLIAVSEATAGDIERYYPGTSGKTVVISHGVDAECFRVGERRSKDRKAPAREKYLLTVSTLHPHKNIDRLMEAFRLFRSSHPEFRLVIAGFKGFSAAELESRRRDLNLEESVTFTGWISREDLYGLFEHADAYIAASRFEGFGMPILEALAAGIPSACSGIQPLVQIAGEAAAHFDPESVPGITAAMELITTDAAFRAHAAVAGPARARLFDWDTTAALTLRQIVNLASPRRRDG
jgi:glycosyltransferase involved in cell wall biosynthesis